MNSVLFISAFFLTWSSLLNRNYALTLHERRPTAASWLSPDANSLPKPGKHRRQVPFGFQGFGNNGPFAALRQGGFSWGDPRRNDDYYVFDAMMDAPVTRPTTSTSKTTLAVPGMETTQSPCEERCRTTFQYNPVCGSNGRTFYNPGRLQCAQNCGQQISLNHVGACT